MNFVETKKNNGILWRKLVFFPSDELINGYRLDRNKDATPQGLLEMWVPDHLVELDVNVDPTFGNRIFVYCDYKLQPTKLMDRIKGKLSNEAFLLGEIENLKAQNIQLRNQIIRENKNPDLKLEGAIKLFNSVAGVMTGGTDKNRGSFPPET